MRSGDFLAIFPDLQPISDTMANLCPACPQPGINLGVDTKPGSSPDVDAKSYHSVDDDSDVLAVTKGSVHAVSGKHRLAEDAAGKPTYQGTKVEGVDWLQRFRRRIDAASSILVVGGGPLGVRESSATTCLLQMI